MRFVLLLAGLTHAYAWQVFPRSGVVWSLTGGLYALFLLVLVGMAYPSARWVCVLLALFQVVVAGCSTAFLVRPWPVVQGQSCTAVTGLPLGILGAVLALVLLMRGSRG